MATHTYGEVEMASLLTFLRMDGAGTFILLIRDGVGHVLLP